MEMGGLSAYEKELIERRAFWRYVRHVGSCYMRASDEHLTRLDRLSLLAALAIPGWISIWFREFFVKHPLSETIMWAGVIAFLTVRASWHSFKRYDIANEKNKMLVEPRLRVNFVNQTGIDRDLSGITFRIMVENTSNKRLENVTLILIDILHDWEDGPPYEVRQIRFPSPLPLTVDFYERAKYSPVFERGLNGRESALFDLLLLKVEGGAMWRIALAPFRPPPDPSRHQWLSVNEFDARLSVEAEPRKLFTFKVSASAHLGAPVIDERTLLFQGPNEGGLPDWVMPLSSTPNKS